MRLRHIVSIALAASLCFPAAAMNVDGYEQLVKRAESRDAKAEPFIARAFVQAHIAGIAETIQVSQTGTQVFRVGDRKVLCFPSNARVSAELVKGALDAELKQPEHLRKTLGPDWRQVPLAFVVVIALQRSFPCPVE